MLKTLFRYVPLLWVPVLVVEPPSVQAALVAGYFYKTNDATAGCARFFTNQAFSLVAFNPINPIAKKVRVQIAQAKNRLFAVLVFERLDPMKALTSKDLKRLRYLQHFLQAADDKPFRRRSTATQLLALAMHWLVDERHTNPVRAMVNTLADAPTKNRSLEFPVDTVLQVQNEESFFHSLRLTLMDPVPTLEGVVAQYALWEKVTQREPMVDHELAQLFDVALTNSLHRLVAWELVRHVSAPGPAFIRVVARHLAPSMLPDDLHQLMVGSLGFLWRSGFWERHQGLRHPLLPLAAITTIFEDLTEAKQLARHALLYLEADYERQLNALGNLGMGLVYHLHRNKPHGIGFPDNELLAYVLCDFLSRLAAWRALHPGSLEGEPMMFWISMLKMLNAMRDDALHLDTDNGVDLRAGFRLRAMDQVPRISSPDQKPVLDRPSDGPYLLGDEVNALLQEADTLRPLAPFSVPVTATEETPIGPAHDPSVLSAT